MHLVISILLLTAGLLAAGCDSGEDLSDTPPDGFTLVGTWAVTDIEGAPVSVDGSNSTWTFRENGTYAWFLLVSGFFDLDGGGSYSLDGRTLILSGVVANTVLEAIPDGRVQLSFGSDTFSFRDDEGDRWTYRRIE